MKLARCQAANIYKTRFVEETVRSAFLIASSLGLPLVVALESWGAGGTRGIEQWIGLGEARGPWKREVLLQKQEWDVRTSIVKVTQNRWRSRVVDETGVVEDGKWRRFESPEWKGAALRAAESYFLSEHIPPLDAAESCCIAIYSARSDEVARVLTKTHLRNHGIDEVKLLEYAIKEGVWDEPDTKKKGRRKSR